jgi:hypothetical protein
MQGSAGGCGCKHLQFCFLCRQPSVLLPTSLQLLPFTSLPQAVQVCRLGQVLRLHPDLSRSQQPSLQVSAWVTGVPGLRKPNRNKVPFAGVYQWGPELIP